MEVDGGKQPRMLAAGTTEASIKLPGATLRIACPPVTDSAVRRSHSAG